MTTEGTELVVTTDYVRARSVQGLDDKNLSFDNVINQPVVIGFFSGLLLSQVQSLFGSSHNAQLALTSLAFTLVALLVARLYLNTLGALTWGVSPRWMSVWLRFLNFFIFTSMLCTTNFFVRTLSDTVQTSLLAWHESLAFVYASMLSLFYVLDLYSSLVIDDVRPKT